MEGNASVVAGGAAFSLRSTRSSNGARVAGRRRDRAFSNLSRNRSAICGVPSVSPGASAPLGRRFLGTACAALIDKEEYGAMLAVQDNRIVPVKLEEIAGLKKLVSRGHPWMESARHVGTVFGD